MLIAGIALIIYGLSIVFAVVGVALIAFGGIARHRRRGGTARIVIGIIVVLIPIATIASSYLPGQS